MRGSRASIVLCVVYLVMAAGCVGPPQPGTATAAPTVIAGPGGVRIDLFEVTPRETLPGDTITLRWQTASQGVEIAALSPDNQYAAHYWALPASGQLQVPLRESDRNQMTYILTVSTLGDPLTAQAVVRLRCPVEWFFSGGPTDTCAQWSAGQHVGRGFAQKFEHGQIIWNGGDNFAVVLYEDAQGGWERLSSDWRQGQPESDPALAPPVGLFQPVRQIGSVWRSEVVPGQPPRLRLGWATAPEAATYTNFQCDSADYYYPNPQTAPCFTAGPGGMVYRLWEKPGNNATTWDEWGGQ